MEKKLEQIEVKDKAGRAQQQVVADLKKEITTVMAAANKVGGWAGSALRRQLGDASVPTSVLTV